MYLSEFLENPVGKGDASIPNKTLIMGALSGKFDNLINSPKGAAIKMRIYRNATSDEYWFWLVIPTETQRDNTYDIVFHFFDREKRHRRDLSIAKYDFQVFTNTPSFAYTYAYVYQQAGLLIPELADRLGREPITQSPDVRNRNQNIMYDKYIYFAARYILESKKMNRVTAEMVSKYYDEKYLKSHIRTLSQIMEEYKKAEDKLKKKKKASENHGGDRAGLPKVRKTTDIGSTVNYVKPGRKTGGTVSKSAHQKSKVRKSRGTIPKR